MEFIEYMVRLRGAREAATDLDLVGRSADKTREAFRGFAHLALGGVGLFAGFEGIKSAVESTQKLAVSASALSKVTGMNVNTSAQWLAVTQAYGISTRTLTMSFRSLSTQTENALGGTKKSQAAFQAMGITMDELRRHSGSMNDLLGLVADRFNKMPGGVQKTQLATMLFGRGWQQLIPLLSEGSKGLDDLRKTAAAYGVTLGKDPLENARKLHEAEVKLHLAQIGMQVQLSEKLAPAFIWVTSKATQVAGVITKALTPAFQFISSVVKDASGWLGKHRQAAAALGVGLGVLVGALIAVKIATIAVNVAMLDNPIGLVIVAVAGLAAGFDYLWHRSENFRTNLTNLWGWLKGSATDATGWVVNAFHNMVSGITSALNTMIDGINTLIDGFNAVSGSLPFGGGPTLGHIGHIGGGGGGAPAATKRRGITPAGADMAPRTITPPGADMAPRGANMSSIHIHIDGREIAHVTRRQIVRAMAANS